MILPEGTKVLVKPDRAEEITKGGIHIPENVREQQQHAITRGTLVALGPEAEVCFCENYDRTGISKRSGKPGDRIMFVKYAGAFFRFGPEREEYRILQDKDVVCYIDEIDEEIPDTRKPF